jgi:hypothetical protein
MEFPFLMGFNGWEISALNGTRDGVSTAREVTELRLMNVM